MKSKIIKTIMLGFMTFCCVLINSPFVARAGVLAGVLTANIPEVPEQLANTCSTIVIAKPSASDTVYMLAGNAEDVILLPNSSIVTARKGNYFGSQLYVVENGQWVYQEASYSIPRGDGNTLPTVYYTTKPIYKRDSSTSLPVPSSEVVFQSTSHMSPTLVGGVTVEPILQTILGLIKLLIPLMVGWVALRKALALLSRILHQA